MWDDISDDDAARNTGRKPTRNGAEPVDEERERRAVDAATSERLDDGVLRDAHGEIGPDPYADDERDASAEVIEDHRRQAREASYHESVGDGVARTDEPDPAADG